MNSPAALWSSHGFSFVLLLDMVERILLSLIFVFMAVSFLHAWMLGPAIPRPSC